MSTGPPSFVAYTGFKRRRLSPFGQPRLLVLRDGDLTVRTRSGGVSERHAVAGLTVTLTRAHLIEVRAGSAAFFLYGLATANGIPRALVRQAQEEARHGIDLALAPADATGIDQIAEAMEHSDGIHAALLAHGARTPQAA